MVLSAEHEFSELRSLERALLQVYRALAPLLACTPANATEEHERLREAWLRNSHEAPAWCYAPADVTVAARALQQAEREVMGARGHPLHACYEARLAELSTELTLIESAGTPRLGEVAQKRFPMDAALEATALQWASLKPAVVENETEGSIAAEVRTLIGKLRLPFRVEETNRISALAATGEDVIYVAKQRAVSRHTARRTAVHEVYGHALPRARAARQGLAIFRFGTAQGHDDQEGYALAREDEHGLFDNDRKREVATRWLVAREMQQGASFVSVVRSLIAREIPIDSALRLASRVFRGSDGNTRGVGRESAYLEGYARVSQVDLALERVVAHGQVACVWAETLTQFVNFVDG